MLRYIVRRVLMMIPTLLVISVLVFTIIQLPPGDYLTTMVNELQSQGENVSQERIAYLREEYGLDRNPVEQYLYWVGGLLQGDLGHSFEHDKPVSEVVGDRMFMTMVVAFVTTLFVYVMSFPIGVYSAVRQYSAGDFALSFLGFIGLATPNFLLALILMYLAKAYFGTDIGGLMDARYIDQPWTWGKAMSVLEHLWVPVIVIGTAGTAGMIRRLRANLLDELHKQYVVTAKAKGLAPGKVLVKYPLRMALNPFIADIGNLLPEMISGAVIVSVVLGLETTGPMLLKALQSQDMYLAGSFLMFISLLTVVGTLISDLALAVLDPRIRLEGGRKR
ncbi:ABC transporter permease [Marinobacterium nitratireducens]|uniref:ABC transporter permease n=1 Tax=Marinobacterium nitratireducens TaxID=518897 RepID=A0A917Z856_9GAMM|nr:ABC transporter permease [Marinobacterium nitratireducens]GGO77085.1 ABC transporter permease [Marinobacterium nitratireducens]